MPCGWLSTVCMCRRTTFVMHFCHFTLSTINMRGCIGEGIQKSIGFQRKQISDPLKMENFFRKKQFNPQSQSHVISI